MIGAAVLLLSASACLIGAAIYAEHALRIPVSITSYPMVSIIQPAIGIQLAIGFVVIEHILVGSGVWCLRKGLRHRLVVSV